MRLFVMLVLLVAAGGCARVPARIPPTGGVAVAEMQVFTDGFHSGVVLPRAWLPREVDPLGPAWAHSRPARSFHYGEEAWTSGEDMSKLHAARLAFWPGVGVVQSDLTGWSRPRIPGTDPDRFRTWTFRLDLRAREAVVQRLQSEWLAPHAMPRLIDDAEATHLFPARHDWSVWWNCHDFTADLVRAAGVDLPAHTIATAGVLTQDLDLAVQAMHRAGVTVLSPP